MRKGRGPPSGFETPLGLPSDTIGASCEATHEERRERERAGPCLAQIGTVFSEEVFRSAAAVSDFPRVSL